MTFLLFLAVSLIDACLTGRVPRKNSTLSVFDERDSGGFKCLLPADPGPCKAAVQRYRYDYITQSCKRFIYGGCQGNGNNFESEKQCEQECKHRHGQVDGSDDGSHHDGGGFKCRLPVDPGPCKAAIQRYCYDYTTQSCKRFIYGGCQGNGNNFESKKECELECKHRHGQVGGSGSDFVPPPDPMRCQQPKDAGPCRSTILRFYFDGNRCRRFIYGGCQGNKNNFETRKTCERICVGIGGYPGENTGGLRPAISPMACEQPKDRGPCRGSIVRFYFDGKRCRRFFYGGCQGNSNNFITKKECKLNCRFGIYERQL
ncbi:hypothetical protein ACOME3_010417 [Neoechinorhynchus agilis]